MMYKKSIIAIILVFVVLFTTSSTLSAVLPANECSGTAFAASSQPTVIRMGGKDRFATAAEIALQGWTNNDVNVYNNVVIVRGSGKKMFADAMSATALAYINDAPILLVDDNKIPEATLTRFYNLRPNNVFIVGGPGVVSENIKSTLSPSCSSIERIYGNDRYETAVKVGDKIKETVDFDTVIIATGNDFPDALTAAPYSAVKHMPIVFVSGNKVNDITKDALIRWNIKKAYIVGGTGVVPETIEDEVRKMGIQVERLGGKDRYETALIIAKYFNTSSDGVAIATGKDYPDALAGAVFAAKKNVPLLLVNYNKLTDSVSKYISEEKFVKKYIFGGTGVVADELIELINKLTGYDENLSNPTNPENAVMGNIPSNIVRFGIAASDNDWIYYSDFYNDKWTGVYKIKKDGTSRTKLSDDCARYLNVVNGWLYYLPMQGENFGKIVKMKTDGSQKTVLWQDSNVLTGSFIVIDNTIYFINSVDQNSLYKADINGENLSKLTNTHVQDFYITGDYIYYAEIVPNANYSIMHKIRTDGLYDTVFPAPYDKKISIFEMVIDNGWIYYTVYKEGLYKIKTDFTKNTKLVADDYPLIIGIKDGWLYYEQFSQGKHNINRIKTDGSSNMVVLNNTDPMQYNIVNDWIIYQIVDGPNSGKMYRLRLSGGQPEQIQ